jgi:hypothetical protein
VPRAREQVYAGSKGPRRVGVAQVVGPPMDDSGRTEPARPLAVDVTTLAAGKSSGESRRGGTASRASRTRWRSGTRLRCVLVFAQGFRRPCECTRSTETTPASRSRSRRSSAITHFGRRPVPPAKIGLAAVPHGSHPGGRRFESG